MVKKALIYNPYFKTLGGGEYYCSQVIKSLVNLGFQVEIAWYERNLIDSLKERFNISLLKGIKINRKAYGILTSRYNLLIRYLFTKRYDLVFYVSNGSIPWLFSKKNWLLFQAPYNKVKGRSILNQLKLKKINRVICYSLFVKKIIDREFKINSQVIYPSVNPLFYTQKPAIKENIILSVGRFDEALNSKKQDILINVFKKLIKNGLKSWRLVLIGGLLNREDYNFIQLLKQAQNYPIEILANVSINTLFSYYQKAKIYWHATGYGEDLKLNPQKAEHFGISIIEAALSNATPLVYKAGGVLEIIKKPQLIWIDEEELITKTNYLINNPLNQKNINIKLKKYLQKFSQENFECQIKELNY